MKFSPFDLSFYLRDKANIYPCDILHWLNEENEPTAYLSLRYADGPYLNSFEFGFYNKNRQKWVTKHSPAFFFDEGNYNIYSEIHVNSRNEKELVIFFTRDNRIITYLHIVMPVDLEYHELKFVADEWNEYENLKLNNISIYQNRIIKKDYLYLCPI
jgi:hypothetical protein